MLWDDWLQVFLVKRDLFRHVPQDHQVLDGSQGRVVLSGQEQSSRAAKSIHVPFP